MMKFNPRNWKGLLLGLAGSILGIGSAVAQNPTSVDIDLDYNSGLNRLEVKLRPNGQGFGDVVSGLTFTIRWAATSTAALGARTLTCPDALPASPVAEVTSGGFKYRTFNGFSDQLLSDWGCEWTANTWVSVCTIPVTGNTGCTQFDIVNDGYTNANNRDFFISLGGFNTTGSIITGPVNFGTCTTDCLGVVGGTALPGTSCDDSNACTTGDTWSAGCVCTGTPVSVTPTVSIGASPSGAICAGTNVTFTATAGNLGGGTASYQWKLNGGNVGTNSSTYSNASLANGNTVSCTITVAGGACLSGTTANSNTVTMNVPTTDDGNPCTLDACSNGNVTHTFQDADGDGTCDANDGCPNDPNKTAPGICGCGVADTDSDGDGIANCNDNCPNVSGQQGSSCNDNNACTINDVLNASCVCVGTFQDTDGDGTCNANDGCPNDPNKIAPGICGCGVADTDSDGDGVANCNDNCPNVSGQQGSTCDDNNACTINDVLNASCVCVGTFEDTDGDGTCNANDGCPNDPNKVAPGACGCGVADTDNDGDGIANCNDNCPNIAGQIGSTCDDGNANTTGDVINASCVCEGSTIPCPDDGNPCTSEVVVSGQCTHPALPDTDNDGTCDLIDGCPNDPNKTSPGTCGCGNVDHADGEACSDDNACTVGDSYQNCVCVSGPAANCDDNDPCTIDSCNPATGCVHTPAPDSDGDGTCDATDGCPNDPNKIAPGICGCGVADTDTDSDGIADCNDPCPLLANLQNGDPCDDGNANTVNDVVTNCVCAGTLLGNDCEGVPGGPAQPGTSCNDNNVCTINDVYQANCTCAGTLQDTDGDGTCDANDGCPNDPNKIAPGICGCGVADTDSDSDGLADCNDPCPLLADLQNGDPCDDGNANTVNDVVTNCVCVGTLLGNDCEGVPGGPAQPGTSCNDNNVCTINDVYQANCTCAGTLQDTDGDGTCDANDGCPTDPNKTAPGICGCGVSDVDTDNDGLADCNDPCPNGANPGASCNDNNACTINDVITANCTCVGTVQDTDGDGTCDANDGCPNDPNKVAPGACGCGVADTDSDNDGVANCNDNCPNIAGQIGSACNDGDSNTTNDVITSDCQCVGTPLGGCTENLTLTVKLDGSPLQTTWELMDQSETTVLFSGGFTANQANTTVNVPICVPAGCYHLRVLDAGGNGITNGGYVLKNAQGKRIIDANGTFGTLSQINTGSNPNRFFCVPIGALNMLSNSCDKTNHLVQSPIYCNAQPGASGYQFWIYDPHGTYNRRVLKTTNSLVPSTLATDPVPVNTTLNVRARAIVNNVYQEFGPTCNIRFVPNSTSRTMDMVIDGVEEAVTVSMSIYPNPNRDGQVTLRMDGLAIDDATPVDVDVYDMLGKRVHSERAYAVEGLLNHSMDLSSDIQVGMYMVNVTIDGKLYTQRMVRQ